MDPVQEKKTPKPKRFKWGFLKSSAVILLVVCIGELIGRMSGGVPRVLAFWEGGDAKLWLVRAFFVCTAGWAFAARESLKRFFRSVYTGVSLVGLSVIAVIAGVLVPQIEGFEDSAVRVGRANYDQQYQQYQWAEGYFVYHILHLYGIGMPEADAPPGTTESLDSFGQTFGKEERDNVEKRMEAAFTGSAKTSEIRTLLVGEDPDAVVTVVGRLLRDAASADARGFLDQTLPDFLDELRADLRAFRSRYHRELASHWRERMAGGRPGDIGNDSLSFLAGAKRRELLAEAVEEDVRELVAAHPEALAGADPAALGAGAREAVLEHDFFGVDAGMRKFFHVATALQLNRAYKSAWFATLLSLLGTAIFFNTFTGKPRSWVTVRRMGFFVTHLGMMTMLAGGAVSKLTTKRGILHLDLRDPPQNEYLLHYDPSQPVELPFWVGLDRFARKEWVQIEVDFPGEGLKTRPPNYTLWEGKAIDLDYHREGGGTLKPRTRLLVRELHDRAEVDVALRESDQEHERGMLGAAVQLTVDEADPRAPGERRRYSLAKIPSWSPYLIDASWEFRLESTYGDLDPENLVGTFPAEGESVGVLYVLNNAAGEAQPSPIRIAPGETYETLSGYSIRVAEVLPSYVVSRTTGRVVPDPRPKELQFPGNPAVRIEITPPEGGSPETRLVRQDVDAESVGEQSGYAFSELFTWLVYDPWAAEGPPRYFLHWGPEGREPVLIDEQGGVQAVRAGEPLPLRTAAGEPTDTRVTPTFFYRRAVVDKNIEFLPAHETKSGGVDLDFYAKTPRGMVVDVISNPDTPQESVETVRMATGEGGADQWRSPDGRMSVRFFENTAMLPFEWRSVLSIYDKKPDGSWIQVDAGNERQREIRVNDYFKWKGYRFFQTNASPDFPTYSGIGVVYDPGIPIVLLGMYTIIAGTVLAFIVRPIVLARRKKEKTA